MATEASLIPLFTVQTVAVDMQKFLPLLRDEFVKQRSSIIEVPSNPGLSTTLANYGLRTDDDIDITIDEQTKELFVFIENFAESYASVCGYNSSVYKARVKNLWLNEMQSSSVHDKHCHYGAHFSGIIYVDVPKDAPGIVFESPTVRFDKPSFLVANNTHINSNVWELPAVEGKMYMWESWLQHQVLSKPFDGVRRSVAFDVVFERI